MSIQPLSPTSSDFQEIQNKLNELYTKKDLTNVPAYYKAFKEIYATFKKYERPSSNNYNNECKKIYNECINKINQIKEVLSLSAGIQKVELSISRVSKEPLEISVSKEMKPGSAGGHSRSVTVSTWGAPVSDDVDAIERNSESEDADDENESPALKSLKEPRVSHQHNESGFINALHAHKPSESNSPMHPSHPSDPSLPPSDLLRREPTRTADLKPIDIPKGCCAIL